jgi:hypothetical protein
MTESDTSSNENTSNDVEPLTCDRCGNEETETEPLVLIEMGLTANEWLLCGSCIEKFLLWVEPGYSQDESTDEITEVAGFKFK